MGLCPKVINIQMRIVFRGLLIHMTNHLLQGSLVDTGANSIGNEGAGSYTW